MANLAPTPKVAAAVLGGIIASAILANITLITPDLFSGLGKWSGLVYGLTITFVMGLSGWLKSEAAASEAPKDAPASDTPTAPQAETLPATAPVAAPAVSFAATQAKIDGLPDTPAPVAAIVEAPAEVAPVAPVA